MFSYAEGKQQFELQGISDCDYADLHEIGRTVCEQCDFEDTFPILIPLSDFEKVTGEYLMDKFNCTLNVVHEIWNLIQKEITLQDISYKTYVVMCKNHIDFQELIEKD